MRASGAATATAERPPTRAATPRPAAPRPAATARAASGLTRPEGIGRSGRSSASTWRSHQSVLLRADRLLEEEAEGGQGAGLAHRHRPRGEAREVEDQRRCEGRVAALPGELHRHPGAEEAVEADVVPGGL